MATFSLVPDIRSGNFYNFAGRGGNRQFSKEDSLGNNIQRIYEKLFNNIPPQAKDALVSTLVEEVPTDHLNLHFLAIANYVVYNLRLSRAPLTPDLFDRYYTYFRNSIFENYKTSDKSQESFDIVDAKVKAEFYLYIKYIMQHSKDFSAEKVSV